MQVYIVFAHPSKNSFSGEVLESFTRGLIDAGHSFEIGDLYTMNFKSELDLPEYKRETGLDPDARIPLDVKAEQEKINKADALVFIYPVWWSDCPAKLKGWFDRVFTYGYAYQYVNREHFTSKIHIEKALVLCPAGHMVEHLEEIGIAESMRCIMLKDRLLGVGVKQAEMEILGGTTGGSDTLRKKHLKRAYLLGKTF
ncbi:MAG: NAD(P)H-dependent oxidoreductase [Candidatus Zixiibacteriota bacterium]